MPADTRRMYPARTSSRWLSTSASAGSSRKRTQEQRRHPHAGEATDEAHGPWVLKKPNRIY